MNSLDKTHFFPQVLQVVPGKNYQVYAYFNDGGVRLIDVSPLIKTGTVFEPLRDKQRFDSLLTVINGTVAWDIGGNRDEGNCIDLDPLSLFDSPLVPDPLAAADAMDAD
jgi:hypothetical protein